MWMYGSRFDTTITSCPRSSWCSTARSASGDQANRSSSRGRRSDSMSRINSRRSRASGRNSGTSGLVRRSQQPFAPQQRAHALFPAAPAQLGDHHRQQRHDHAEADEQGEHVPPRLLAAARHEAHVVEQHEVASGPPRRDAAGAPTSAAAPGGSATMCPLEPENESRSAQRTAGRQRAGRQRGRRPATRRRPRRRRVRLQ